MKSRFVLLVEDNPDDVKLTLKAFERSRLALYGMVLNEAA